MSVDRKTAEQRKQDLARHFPTLLKRWRGASAQLADLSLSHPTLTILIRHTGKSGNLVIACIGPTRIHAPHQWDNCNIEVAMTAGGGFLVVDSDADVEISTEHVEIFENVKEYARP